MNKHFLLAIILFSAVSAKSQSIDRYTAINHFLSIDSVKKLLLFDNNKISWLQCTDSTAIGSHPAMGYAGNYHFKFTTDTTLQKPIKPTDCALYLVSCTKKGDGWLVEIMQSCSSLVCQGEVRKTKQKISDSSLVVFAR